MDYLRDEAVKKVIFRSEKLVIMQGGDYFLHITNDTGVSHAESGKSGI